jgi:hypothetical protein
MFFVASAIPLRGMASVFPFVAGVRHPAQIAGLAVPLIVGLASIGLERVWTWTGRARMFGLESPHLTVAARGIVLIALAATLWKVEHFGSSWLGTERLTKEVESVLRAIEPESTQWVALPFGEHLFVEPAIAAGWKLSPGTMAYRWRDVDPPTALIEAHRYAPPMEGSVLVGRVEGIGVYRNPVAPYAAVFLEDGRAIECAAQAAGGDIDVTCPDHPAGALRVLEHNYPGWKASVEGRPAAVERAAWLTVTAPSGARGFSFRYRPWDVPAGLVGATIGMLAIVWLGLPASAKAALSRRRRGA